jgi:hypothetical protein
MTDAALYQRIQLRLDRKAEPIQPRKPFDATVRQADVLGACQVVNRYRCHGPKLRRAIAVGEFLIGCSVPALGVIVGLAGLAMVATKAVMA